MADEIVENRRGGGVTVWRRVIMLADCDINEDDEAICPVCDVDYAECDCPGPTQDDLYRYKTIKGMLYAAPKEQVQLDMGNLSGVNK